MGLPEHFGKSQLFVFRGFLFGSGWARLGFSSPRNRGAGNLPNLFPFLTTAASFQSIKCRAPGKHHSTHRLHRLHLTSSVTIFTSISLFLINRIKDFWGLYSPWFVMEQINSQTLQPLHFSISTTSVFLIGIPPYSLSCPFKVLLPLIS